MQRSIITHGGAGAPRSLDDGCQAAARAGMERLRAGASALDAAIAAVVALEDDGRYNAGSGSVLRLDGESVEMDAAVMDSRGTLGCVAGLERVRNPVLVARAVADTPHVFLAGPGATAFARRAGFPEYRQVSLRARARHETLVEAWRRGDKERVPAAWRSFDLRRYWNFHRAYDEVFGHDTVGAVALAEDGTFAVAGSTGGSVPMLRGRVGDSPIVGCGFYAGPHGAVAATGIGEEIMRRTLCKDVYESMASGTSAQAACEAGVARFPKDVPVGLVAAGKEGYGVAANVPMAHAVMEE